MLIKAKPTKRGRAAFLSQNATDQEIDVFFEFQQAAPKKPAEAKQADKGKGRENACRRSAAGEKAAKKRPLR